MQFMALTSDGTTIRGANGNANMADELVRVGRY
jgi:hypothetical protein